ncbi:ATP-dependent helicase HrpB [Shewanella indica]|uniref:ATP-dependent helicase HrpB n=1 Tax=Shewanella indica TaxID=768528 RepID=UPI0008F92A76|nr:ATP-dependent helicase HrpB [Shewanella algae]
MNDLPIQSLLPQLRQTLASCRQVILEAPTGAGKSTALPLALLDWPEIDGKILMLEPRRVAARAIAGFLARQRGQALGQEVGFRVRGESQVSGNTRLEIITEGVLTRMIQQDPELKGVAMIIFDEIHERHLSTDLGLALALEVQASLRDDLHLLAMSATLEGLPLHTLMPDAKLLASEGRSYPVTTAYSAALAQRRSGSGSGSGMAPWLEHMGRQLLALLDPQQASALGVSEAQQQGSILAFLPGQGEIQRLKHYLQSRVAANVRICPLYGSLSAKEQDAAIAPANAGERKLVLSTNLAESSLTIEGITLVVDSGYKRQASFNPRSGVTRLGLKRISQASATQRAGRAGRTSAGFCLRLWGQEEHGRLPQADEPEILHADLLSMALDAACWGVRSLSDLPLLTPPARANEAVAWQLLQSLQLVDRQRKLSAHGRAAYALGAQPRLAHMLLRAQSLGQGRGEPELAGLACLLAALLEARSLAGNGADIMDKLSQATQGLEARQVGNWLRRLGLNGKAADFLKLANRADCALLLALAFPDRIAKARGVEGYQLANGSGVVLDAGDSLSGCEFLVVADYQETEGRSAGRIYLAAELPAGLLENELAFLCTWQQQAGWDESKGRFFAERQLRLGEIVLKREAEKEVDPKLRAQAIMTLLRSKGLALLNMDEDVRQLQFRLALARSKDPSLFPDSSDPALLDSLEEWLEPFLSDIKQLKGLMALDIKQLLLNRLEWQAQQMLNEWLPSHWKMATGTRAPIRYDAGGRALLSVRLQEALGMAESPRLLQGELTVTMELLSPAQRPLALTADLASFWQGPYVEVKKEMRGRYPKHLWPDDPANTLPTKFTKKKTLNIQQ